MRRLAVVLALLALPAVALGQGDTVASSIPLRGFVPDSATAIRIAVAVWIPIYGEKGVMAVQPFVAQLAGGIWTVTGTLPPGPNGIPLRGGTPLARISQRDGRILLVAHYQ
jgi:hypothetical protein